MLGEIIPDSRTASPRNPHVIDIDKADQAQWLDDRNEFAASHNAAFRLAHPKQAFKIVHHCSRGTHDRLEGKKQPNVTQCAQTLANIDK
jgi:hypothetical protein